MTVSPPSISQTDAPSERGEMPAIPLAEIDGSCRMPVLTLFLAAVLWLAIGSLLGVITAIKAHAPGFLAEPGWLTYGRVRPAAANALAYGFALQAGLGMALWMFCRLGQTVLRGARMITGATGFWNVGLMIGVTGILAGGSTGFEWLEMPGKASLILFCSYILVAAWAIITLHSRRQRKLYVSQWLLLTSLLWFPWVYSTAQLLLVYFPVRGVMQAIVSGWYAHNLFELCLASFGLASIFYFIPKLLCRPLHSHGLALFGFWLLVFLGGWGGARMGLPVPNWIGSVSFVARVFLLVAVAAFSMSWYRTWKGARADARSAVLLRFIQVGAASYVVAAVLETAGAHPAASRLTLFTLYDQGIVQLKIHGFIAMALAAAVYYVAPRLTGGEWPSSGLIRLHFWCAASGLGLSTLALLIGGLLQGSKINQPEIEFMRVVRTTVPFLGMSTLGATLLAIGYAAFGINFGRLLMACCPCSTIIGQLRAARSTSGSGARDQV